MLRPEPGDVVVLEARRSISPTEAEAIGRQWEGRFPDVRVVVLGGSLRLGGVVRREDVGA